MKALIFAAGLGSRLKEETLNKPKALVEVGGIPLLQHAIEKLKKEEVEEVVVNVHHFSKVIIDFITNHNFGIPVKISDETGNLLDTGGGLKKAAPLLQGKEPVLLYNVDILSNLNIKKVINYHCESRALATLVVRNRVTYRYFRFNADRRLVGWVNRKNGQKKISIPTDFDNATDMAFSGIHIINTAMFKYLPHKKRFSITDWYLEMANKHLIKGYFDDSEFWMDVGRPKQLAEARKRFS